MSTDRNSEIRTPPRMPQIRETITATASAQAGMCEPGYSLGVHSGVALSLLCTCMFIAPKSLASVDVTASSCAGSPFANDVRSSSHDGECSVHTTCLLWQQSKKDPVLASFHRLPTPSLPQTGGSRKPVAVCQNIGAKPLFACATTGWVNTRLLMRACYKPALDDCSFQLTWSVFGAQKHQKKGDCGQLGSIGGACALPHQLCAACSQQGGYGADNLISKGYHITPKTRCPICKNATCTCADSMTKYTLHDAPLKRLSHLGDSENCACCC